MFIRSLWVLSTSKNAIIENFIYLFVPITLGLDIMPKITPEMVEKVKKQGVITVMICPERLEEAKKQGIKMLPINRLITIGEPHLKEEMTNEEYYELLKEDISKNGLKDPLVVENYSSHRSDYFMVLDGWHRLEACRRLGWKEVPCYVLPVYRQCPCPIAHAVEKESASVPLNEVNK